MSAASDIFEKIANVEDARLCEDIDEQACRESPGNFAVLFLSFFLTKLGDAVASPKTTLAWLVTAVGAPAYVLGFLVPLRESGSLIPQLFIGGFIRRLSVRKWIWVLGSVAQAACIVGIGIAALLLEGASAGYAILALVALFSLARGFCSVASKDVIGKTIPKLARGQLTGWSASAAGLVTVGIGAVLMSPFGGVSDESTIAGLLVGAGLLWVLAALTFSRVEEYAGETGGGRSAAEALGSLDILRTDKPFRRFVVTRALLMCSALSAPFYVALSQEASGASVLTLGGFILAAGLASLVSAPFWGRFADRSSRQVMIAAAILTSTVGLVTAAAQWTTPSLAAGGWFIPLAYFALSVAHSGVRVGRKTYVVDLGTGNKRTDYVAISNSIIGILLLLLGSVGILASAISNAGVIALLAIMGLFGAAMGTTLPEAER